MLLIFLGIIEGLIKIQSHLRLEQHPECSTSGQPPVADLHQRISVSLKQSQANGEMEMVRWMARRGFTLQSAKHPFSDPFFSLGGRSGSF